MSRAGPPPSIPVVCSRAVLASAFVGERGGGFGALGSKRKGGSNGRKTAGSYVFCWEYEYVYSVKRVEARRLLVGIR